jgi:DNA helicase-2/ATP-dependent DNA helicase PcrA
MGLVDGVFPSARSLTDGDDGDIEEEKRLFYVAVTRAKDELFLSFANRSGSTERSISQPCRFLEPQNVKRTIEERTVRSTVKAVNRSSKHRKYRRR